MICVAARNLEDGATVVVGTGAPCAAAMLAQKTHSPNLTIMFEAGGVAPILPAMPISVGDSRTFYRAILASSMPEIMETCQRGMVDYTFLGGAQIDMYGNINSTMVGDNHAKPKVRFPGSGGANDLASLCWRTMMMTPQDAKRFTEKINFITSPGYLVPTGSSPTWR
jgi:glutaconate CoA-transferase subunit B